MSRGLYRDNSAGDLDQDERRHQPQSLVKPSVGRASLKDFGENDVADRDEFDIKKRVEPFALEVWIGL